jgi:hypothetical protein
VQILFNVPKPTHTFNLGSHCEKKWKKPVSRKVPLRVLKFLLFAPSIYILQLVISHISFITF